MKYYTKEMNLEITSDFSFSSQYGLVSCLSINSDRYKKSELQLYGYGLNDILIDLSDKKIVCEDVCINRLKVLNVVNALNAKNISGNFISNGDSADISLNSYGVMEFFKYGLNMKCELGGLVDILLRSFHYSYFFMGNTIQVDTLLSEQLGILNNSKRVRTYLLSYYFILLTGNGMLELFYVMLIGEVRVTSTGAILNREILEQEIYKLKHCNQIDLLGHNLGVSKEEVYALYEQAKQLASIGVSY